MIVLENLLRVYGKEAVLNHVNIEIKAGELVAITGPSGCGKTTLLNIIGMIDENYQGIYRFENTIRPRLSSSSGRKLLQKRIGFIFQNFALIENETVKNNFKIVSKYNNSNITMTEALEQVGLSGFENKYVYQLSGGEQQRVAIAKLICKDSDLILADEPTGSLDADNRDLVMDLIVEMNNRGKTIIIVTHDSNIASRCGRIIKMEELK